MTNNTFLQQLAPFTAKACQAHANDDAMLGRVAQLQTKLAPQLDLSRCNSSNPVAETAANLMIAVESQIAQWRKEWTARSPMRQLSADFADRFVLLIFGKVNAGKSSLINYLADELALSLGVTPEYFQLQDGKRCAISGPLKEGATETTSHIQGVLLGEHLAVIDTPGLHSVTTENAELTRRYTDAADAVIWLTPSTNPGLVQELDELKLEISLGKPLLPVISKSDTVQESIDPQTEELQSKVIPKDPHRRQLQEIDVALRAKEHLGAHKDQLLSPLSLSIRCAKADQAQDHGIPALYQALGELVMQATTLKGTKWQIQQEGFWQREVQGKLEQLLPKIQQLTKTLVTQRQELQHISQVAILEATARLISQWPSLVQRHASKGGEAGLQQEYQERFHSELQIVLTSLLAPFFDSLPSADSILTPDAFGHFEQQLIQYQVPERKKRGNKSMFLSFLGGVVGLLFKPLGLMNGILLGGLLDGNSDDDEASGYRTVTAEGAIDSSAILARGSALIERDVQQAINGLIGTLFNSYLDPLDNYCHMAMEAIALLSQKRPSN